MSRRYAGTRAGRNTAVRRARGGWRSARTSLTGPPVYSCPNPGCDGELVEDAHAMWCPAGQHAVPYALLRDDPENDEDF